MKSYRNPLPSFGKEGHFKEGGQGGVDELAHL